MPGQYTCARCGAPFTAWPSNRRQFCGRTCYQAPRGAAQDALSANPDGSIGIPLCGRGRIIRGYAIVDATDAEWANQWRWCRDSSGSGYAVRNSRPGEGHRRLLYLHRELPGIGFTEGSEIDHINRDRLDNRRENLRVIPKAGNRQNLPSRGGSSAYRGVSWNKNRKKWIAYMTVDGKRHALGFFNVETDAAEAAREARARLMPFSTD